jgi:hypothetical protein
MLLLPFFYEFSVQKHHPHFHLNSQTAYVGRPDVPYNAPNKIDPQSRQDLAIV